MPAPIIGTTNKASIARINGPDEICARLQPYSCSSGPIITPSE
jgi:hypothetical protein